MKFEDKIVLVTGGSRGIGREIAIGFAQRGARVAVHYHRNLEAAQATKARLAGDGHIIVQADIAEPASVKRMVDGVVERMGRIDILVNNAGIHEERLLTETSFEDWVAYFPRILAVNLLAWPMRYTAPPST